jgi:hypothetical protein
MPSILKLAKSVDSFCFVMDCHNFKKHEKLTLRILNDFNTLQLVMEDFKYRLSLKEAAVLSTMP